jgi:hypothetical protein
VDFEKDFDSIHREVLWYKMRKMGVSENMVNCIEIMYQDTKFCVRCGENQRSSHAPPPPPKELCQGCGFSPYLFNIFINDIIAYIDNEETYSPVIQELKIPGLLLGDGLVVVSSTSYGLHKKVERVN